MRALSYGLAVAVVLCSGGAVPVPVTFTTIDRGAQSNVEEARDVIVRTAAEWDALWKLHAGDRPRPAVDFARSTVVGVFLGSRPTAGYGVEITGIARDGDNLVVTYREAQPGRSAMVGQVLTMPFHLVRLERHAGPIQFKRAATSAGVAKH